MLWIMIMAVVLAFVVLAFIYMERKLSKVKFIEKLAKGNKWLRALMSSGIIIAVFVIISLLTGYINGIIVALHIVAFILIADVIMWLIGRTGKNIHRWIGDVVALVFTVGYLSVGWYLAHNVWTTNYVIDTDKNVGNIRVVQIADSHIGTTFDGEGFQKYVDEMQGANPDVVVITGDFVDDDTSREDMIAACKALGTLKPTYGVYYSFGNHDKGYYGAQFRGYSGDDLIAELKKNNVIVLQDENVLIDDRFYIIGRQDRSEVEKGGSRADVDELMNGIDKSKYIIMLDHQPNDYDNEQGKGVDLVLSGHTHGGQLLPVTYVGEWTGTNDLTYGHVVREGTDFIVTSGISDWAIDFKTGCKSEFVVIEINGN